MRNILAQFKVLAATISMVATAPAAFADITFDSLLADRPAESPAAVLYVWSPDGTRAIASGTIRTGARAASVTDQFYVASVSKTYLATAILQLHEAGHLTVHDLASAYLPRRIVRGFGGMQGITIENLLRMQSGLAEYLTDDFEKDVQASPGGPWSPEQVLSYAFDTPSEHRPGTGFDYSNTNYVLLQMILETVTGRSMHDYLASEVLRPSGARGAHVHGTRPRADTAVHGYENIRGNGLEDVSWYYQTPLLGDGFLVTSAEEIVAFYRALLVDQTLLGEATLSLMLKDDVHEGYGMGIEVEDDPDLGIIIGHSGGDNGFSAHVYYMPDLDLIAVSLRADDTSDAALIYHAVQVLTDW